MSTFPLSFKQKTSSSPSTDMHTHKHVLSDHASYCSPLPLPAPLHLTRRSECTQHQVGDLDDPHAAQKYNAEVHAHSWSFPHMHRPLPSLVTKFAARDAPPHSPSPYPYASKTTYFCPQVDSETVDDYEEYDLESMDIHIRETYFATSAERGRWMSSPIAPRVRSQPIPPMRGHSSPIKRLADSSPLKEHFRKHTKGHSVDENISISPEDCDEYVHCSSSLPPSSPLSSPMSNLSFLSDHRESDSVVDPRSNSDDYHSLSGTPGLSISSTACTSPVDPTCTATPHEMPSTTMPVLQSTTSLCHPAGSIISHHANTSPPLSINLHVHAPDAADLEPDCILSPLSQFESDLPETETPKLPLSDTVNKSYPGQYFAGSIATVYASRSQEGPASVRMGGNHECHDASLDKVRSNKRAKKRRDCVIGNPGTSRAMKSARSQSGSPRPDAKRKKGVGGCSSNHPEHPNKKSKLTHCSGASEGRGAKSFPTRGRMVKVERPSRSPSCLAAEHSDRDLESACPRNRKGLKPIGRAEIQQPTPNSCTTPVSVGAVDAEFYASLTGMVIEALATSRATSMDVSALHLVVTQAHPYLAVDRSKAELSTDIGAVLEAGRSRCGMFEKVDGSGERSRHRALASRWFYVPERDEDRERASLISALMPRQKRSETKKYKQYYYRPLDKMSRWDPEDAP